MLIVKTRRKQTMKASYFYLKRTAIVLVVLFVLVGAGDIQAQFEFRWMTVGRMQSPYSEGGADREQEPFDNAPVQFPSINWRAGNNRAYGFWIGAKNFTDETGRVFPFKVAHIGPRSGGEVQFFPTSIEVITRIDPEVEVDGAKSFRRFTFIDDFDPNMKADRLIHIVNTSRVGIDTDQKIYAFSQQFHDNYHIIEYNFTNTGNVDEDPEIELNASLEGVYFFFVNRYSLTDAASWVNGNGAPWGKFTMNDAVGDGHEDYEVDFRAQYVWYGHNVFQAEYNVLGGPMWQEHWTSASIPDTTGRLAGAHMVGRVYIHADGSTTDNSDDPGQPSTMAYKGSDDPDLVDSEFDDGLMRRQYENFMSLGRVYPHHADIVEPEGNFDKPTNDPASAPDPASGIQVYDEGGWAFVEGFGPYDMAPGESINLVIAEAAAGLSEPARLEIGRAYKRSGANDDLLIPYEINGQTISMTKNQWVLTTKDSLFRTFERAIANYESGFNIPQPPLAPARFVVTGLPGKIALEWEAYPEASQTGFEIWRASKIFTDPTAYELIASLGPEARSFDDTGAVRGIEYYYYIIAIGDINNDATGLTPTGVRLVSNRHYTQTYLPATLKRPAGTLADVRIVPNPFNLATDENLRYPDKQDKLGFLNIPGQCTITIYTQLGERITTIEHTDGSGDEFWDHTTKSRQVIASGVYIAVIKDLEAGTETKRKFVIIR